ncbi:hypothetical protein [Bacillus pumilus]|uniref:hypothetical protein n=1 Tax=Bacillus pumilus TaxID=1408 RepID=UPI000D02C465|nr:hypothetical protein [Bacillus pumilus]PRS65273.1 hypothetical protein C6X97_02575 [Bacillus pumilus]
MGKKKKRTNKNKIRSEKTKKIDNEIYSEKLMELEDAIYTYRTKDLLAYFFQEFKYGQEKNHYKKNVLLLYDLDIECLEFAISRFWHIDNARDPAKYLAFITPFITAYITTSLKIYENTWTFSFVWLVSLLVVTKVLDNSRRDRSVAGTMLKTFEQVHARKQKEKE